MIACSERDFRILRVFRSDSLNLFLCLRCLSSPFVRCVRTTFQPSFVSTNMECIIPGTSLTYPWLRAASLRIQIYINVLGVRCGCGTVRISSESKSNFAISVSLLGPFCWAQKCLDVVLPLMPSPFACCRIKLCEIRPCLRYGCWCLA